MMNESVICVKFEHIKDKDCIEKRQNKWVSFKKLKINRGV